MNDAELAEQLELVAVDLERLYFPSLRDETEGCSPAFAGGKGDDRGRLG